MDLKRQRFFEKRQCAETWSYRMCCVLHRDDEKVSDRPDKLCLSFGGDETFPETTKENENEKRENNVSSKKLCTSG